MKSNEVKKNLTCAGCETDPFSQHTVDKSNCKHADHDLPQSQTCLSFLKLLSTPKYSNCKQDLFKFRQFV